MLSLQLCGAAFEAGPRRAGVNAADQSEVGGHRFVVGAVATEVRRIVGADGDQQTSFRRGAQWVCSGCAVIDGATGSDGGQTVR